MSVDCEPVELLEEVSSDPPELVLADKPGDLATAEIRPANQKVFPTFLIGLLLCLLAMTWDFLPSRNWLPMPLSPLVFLVFLFAQFLVTEGGFRKANAQSVALGQKLTETELALLEAAEAYSRFVPEQFLRHLNRKSISQVKLGDQVARGMTVMFADIRNFTSISETMSPEENFRMLNDYLGHIGPIIREQYGFIDKYIGDAIMALFDGPVDEAIAAAVGMQLATTEYNKNRPNAPHPITIGIGLHSGPLMLGVIGEVDRMESTVIADSVNLASRIESLTKYYDCRILLTRSTFEAQSDPFPYFTRPVDLVRVKGRTEPVDLLEILDERFDSHATLKIELSAHLAEALVLYRRGEFHEARILFQHLAYQDPKDLLYGIYRRRVEELIRLGAPPGWDGANDFAFK